jgi:uncharacterized protein YbjT (DUF2867 family)
MITQTNTPTAMTSSSSWAPPARPAAASFLPCENLGVPVRLGSRSASPAFDWNNAANWDECLEGVTKLYINYAPDLAMPGATDAISELVRRARSAGVKHLVLLSGRGEAEAQACEAIIQDSGIDWTIVRASWFNQNFSEGAFIDMVQAGQITLPDVSTPEPFVDVDDIAEVAVVALTQPGHAGELYEVTGPRMLTLADVAEELSKATGRTISVHTRCRTMPLYKASPIPVPRRMYCGCSTICSRRCWTGAMPTLRTACSALSGARRGISPLTHARWRPRVSGAGPPESRHRGGRDRFPVLRGR